MLTILLLCGHFVHYLFIELNQDSAFKEPSNQTVRVRRYSQNNFIKCNTLAFVTKPNPYCKVIDWVC